MLTFLLTDRSNHFVRALLALRSRLLHFRGSRFLGGAFQIQGQELFQNLFVA